ncbi:UDP-N-acetylenolpyruvoylglucosamine reductase [Helicobacter valdiviensis]|uniref:UDP-N-acetylenolpyruvoylglucosamine reductase n=1 Tax=Helicobacter valdiviensis TaxID=1458358 RepID=A0A2W6PPD0_9HELI|nr:UDP-N-acetylmuramate dehydrogenase [Helicobacter valdiviensis]PZT48583.1 UDP-N-acetylenolpyruvoylglucosamine reductase [Helicobacter valdiviensis]
MQKKYIDFKTYSSIKVGGICEVYEISNPQDYYTLLQSGNPLNIIGKANNLLISPQAKNLIILSKDFDYIKDCGEYLEVGALTPSGKLYSYAKKHNLAGFEILRGLPGCIGGIIKMNAGLKEYEIKSSLLGILCLKNNPQLEFVKSDELSLEYRKSNINTLIFAGIFKKDKGFDENLPPLFASMRQNQPSEPSFGSCFKNPSNNYAGFLIESVGLKGKKFGKNKSLMFSQKHANFLVNLGDSSFLEVLDLIELAKKCVQEKHNILLEEEVQIFS